MNPQVVHSIEILDAALNLITPIFTPYPLDGSGNIMRYSKELSDFGTCTFRISSYDPLLTKFGAIYTPHKYHVRIRRAGIVVWSGAIIEIIKQNKDFIEVTAAEYLWYLGKKLIHRTSNDPVTGTANGIYRIFQSGNMAQAVTAIMNETLADWSNYSASVNGQGITILDAGHILSTMTLGEIDNPDYPPNITDGNGNALSGGWQFVPLDTATGGFTLQYDFQTVLYVLKSFGAYTYADFTIDENLQFSFRSFLGNDQQYQVNLVWGKRGNAYDYNIPSYGQRMINSLVGVATDNNGVVLFYNQADQTSITDNGLIEGVAAYSDVKAQSILQARIQAELPLISTPDDTAMSMVLNERTNYPIGTWDIGDIITCTVTNAGLSFNEPRRVVGITTTVGNTGRELTTIQTNKPLPWQYGNGATN